MLFLYNDSNYKVSKSPQCCHLFNICILEINGAKMWVNKYNSHPTRGSTTKIMNNKRINYFSYPYQQGKSFHMELSGSELSSQMFQHLLDPFAICQSRKFHQGGDMYCPPECLSTSEIKQLVWLRERKHKQACFILYHKPPHEQGYVLPKFLLSFQRKTPSRTKVVQKE